MDAEVRALGIAAFGEDARVADEACAAYAEERDVILRYLLSLDAPLADAQELTQEVFLAYYAALRGGAGISVRRAWLFVVASRKFLNWRKSRSRRAALALDDGPAESIADSAQTPEARLLALEKDRAIHAAIQSLSTQQRICLHLRSEGLHYREIADILGISVQAVAEFLRRAIARIRREVHA